MKDKSEDKKEEKKDEGQAKNAWAEELEKRKKLQRQKEQERMNKNETHIGSRSINRKQFTRNRRSTQGGSSTIEILVAFVVITLAVTAVMMVVFGNQSFAIDTKVSQRALYHAERGIEMAYASSTMTSTTTNLFSEVLSSIDDIYNDELKINIASALCFRTVQSSVSWKQERRATSTETLFSKFVDIEESLKVNGDCPTGDPEDDWDNPTSFGIADLIHSGSKPTDLDVVETSDYKFAIITSQDSGDKLWVIDVTASSTPILKGSYNPGDDLLGVDAVVNGSSIFAFVASASTTAQVQAIEIDLTGYPGTPPAISQYWQTDMPLVDEGATSIYYYDSKIYAGTFQKSGPGADEFHVYSDILNPSGPSYSGGVDLNHTVNDIAIQGDYAYLATTADLCEVIVIDVSNPGSMTNPCPAGGGNENVFNALGDEDAESIYVAGGQIFLGRDRAKDYDDLFILKIADVQDGDSPSDGVIGSKDLDDKDCKDEDTGQKKPCLGPSTAITGLSPQGSLLFLATTQQTAEFQVWDVSDSTNIKPNIGCNAYEFPAKPVSIDFLNNIGYVAVDSNDALRIIYDQPGVCSK